ncbi:MAG: rhodanese [Melioribacteraceae bacterium]|nr:MAG: rhodanese [Melioribacteraceae bacterium]
MSGLFGSLFGGGNGVVNLDSDSFEKQMKEDKEAVLIDTRTLGEFNDGHIPDAKLIDIYSPSFQEEIDKLDRNKSYYVYCRSGNRSYHAGLAMKKMGFEKVYNLESGIIGWYGEVVQ